MMKSPQSTYPLRLPKSVKAQVERRAKADGMSVNQFVATAVAEKASSDEHGYLLRGAARPRGLVDLRSDHAPQARRSAAAGRHDQVMYVDRD